MAHKIERALPSIFRQLVAIQFRPNGEILSQLVKRLAFFAVMLAVKREHVLVLADEVIVYDHLRQI